MAYVFKNPELPKSFQKSPLMGKVREGCDSVQLSRSVVSDSL